MEQHLFERIRLAQPEGVMNYGHELSKAGNEMKWQWADYTDIVYRHCVSAQLEATKKDCAAWVSYTFCNGTPAPLTIYDYALVAAYFPQSIGGEISLREKYNHLPFEHFVAAKDIAHATGFSPADILASSSPLMTAAQLRRDFLDDGEDPYEPAYQEQTFDVDPPPYNYTPTDSDKPYIVVEAENAVRSIKRIQDIAGRNESRSVKVIAQTLYLMLEQLTKLIEEFEGVKE